MGRPPLEKKQQQFTVSLPPEVRSRLEAAATAAGHSIAGEIRRRIDQTIAWEKLDPATLEFLRGIETLVPRLKEDFGVEWSRDYRAHHAFSLAVADRLMAYKPPSVQPGTAAADLEFGDPEAFDVIARMRERDDRKSKLYVILEDVEKLRQLVRGRATTKAAKKQTRGSHD